MRAPVNDETAPYLTSGRLRELLREHPRNLPHDHRWWAARVELARREGPYHLSTNLGDLDYPALTPDDYRRLSSTFRRIFGAPRRLVLLETGRTSYSDVRSLPPRYGRSGDVEMDASGDLVQTIAGLRVDLADASRVSSPQNSEVE